MKGGKGEGVEEPVIDGANDEPGNKVGRRPYVLYHERWGHDSERRISMTTALRDDHGDPVPNVIWPLRAVIM